MVNASDVVGYTYDADIHCPTCAAKRFSAHTLMGKGHETDGDGNPPNPIFGDQADGDVCSDCGDSLTGGSGHWYTR